MAGLSHPESLGPTQNRKEWAEVGAGAAAFSTEILVAAIVMLNVHAANRSQSIDGSRVPDPTAVGRISDGGVTHDPFQLAWS